MYGAYPYPQGGGNPQPAAGGGNPQPQPLGANPAITLGVTGQLLQVAGMNVSPGIGRFLYSMGGAVQAAGRNPLIMHMPGDFSEFLNTLHTGYLFVRSLTLNSLSGILNQLASLNALMQAQVGITASLLQTTQLQAVLLGNFVDAASLQQVGFFGFNPVANIGLYYAMRFGQFILPAAAQLGQTMQGLTLGLTGDVYLSGMARTIATSYATRYTALPFLMQQAYAGRMGGFLEGASSFATRTLGRIGLASPEEFYGGFYFASEWNYGRFTGRALGDEIREAIREFREVARELRVTTQAAMSAGQVLGQYGFSRPQIFQALQASYTRSIGGTLQDWLQSFMASANVLGSAGIAPQYATLFPALAGLVLPSAPERRAQLAAALAQAAVLTGAPYMSNFGPLAMAAGQQQGFIAPLTAGAGVFGQLGVAAPMVRSGIEQFANPVALSRMMFSGINFYTNAVFGGSGPIEQIMYLTYLGMPFRSAVEVAMALNNFGLLNFLQTQQQAAQTLATLGYTTPRQAVNWLDAIRQGPQGIASGLITQANMNPAMAHALAGVFAPALTVAKQVAQPAVEIGLILYGMRYGLKTLQKFFGVGKYEPELAALYRQIMRMAGTTSVDNEILRQTFGDQLTRELLEELGAREITSQELYRFASERLREVRRRYMLRQIVVSTSRFGQGTSALAYTVAELPVLRNILYGTWEVGAGITSFLTRLLGPGLVPLMLRYARTGANILIPWSIHSALVGWAEQQNPEVGPFTAAVNQNLMFLLGSQAIGDVIAGRYTAGQGFLAGAALATAPLIMGREGFGGILPALGTSMMIGHLHGEWPERLLRALSLREGFASRALGLRIGKYPVFTPTNIRAALLFAGLSRAIGGRLPGAMGVALDIVGTAGSALMMFPHPYAKAAGAILAFAGYGLGGIAGGLYNLFRREREIDVTIESASPAEQMVFLAPERLRRIAAGVEGPMSEVYMRLADVIEGKALTAGSLEQLAQTLETNQGLAEYMRLLAQYENAPSARRKRVVKATAKLLQGIVNSNIDLKKLSATDRLSAVYTIYAQVARFSGEKMAKEVLSEMGFSSDISRLEAVQSGLMKDLISRMRAGRKDLRYLAEKYGLTESLVMREAARLGFRPDMSVSEIASIAPEWFATEEGRKELQERAREIAARVEELTGIKISGPITTKRLISIVEGAIQAGGSSAEELRRLRQELELMQSMGFTNEMNLPTIRTYEEGLVVLASLTRDLAEIVAREKEKK